MRKQMSPQAAANFKNDVVESAIMRAMKKGGAEKYSLMATYGVLAHMRGRAGADKGYVFRQLRTYLGKEGLENTHFWLKRKLNPRIPRPEFLNKFEAVKLTLDCRKEAFAKLEPLVSEALSIEKKHEDNRQVMLAFGGGETWSPFRASVEEIIGPLRELVRIALGKP